MYVSPVHVKYSTYMIMWLASVAVHQPSALKTSLANGEQQDEYWRRDPAFEMIAFGELRSK